jgi:hypothetical protein
MIAVITHLASRPGEGEAPDTQERRPVPFQSLEAGPTRDSFVAHTAVKIDQLQANVRIITRKLEELSGKVTELQEACTLEDRWYGFHQSEKRARENKLDEMVRGYRDLKARLDCIHGRTGGDYHAYNNFDAVSRKLCELERKAKEPADRKGRAWLLPTVFSAKLIVFGLGILAISMLTLSAELGSHAPVPFLSAPVQIGEAVEQ